MVVGSRILKPLVFGIDLLRADWIALGDHAVHCVGVEGRKVTEFRRHFVPQFGKQGWVGPEVYSLLLREYSNEEEICFPATLRLTGWSKRGKLRI